MKPKKVLHRDASAAQGDGKSFKKPRLNSPKWDDSLSDRDSQEAKPESAIFNTESDSQVENEQQIVNSIAPTSDLRFGPATRVATRNWPNEDSI